MPFYKLFAMKNPLHRNVSFKEAQDGQELESRIGWTICLMIHMDSKQVRTLLLLRVSDHKKVYLGEDSVAAQYKADKKEGQRKEEADRGKENMTNIVMIDGHGRQNNRTLFVSSQDPKHGTGRTGAAWASVVMGE